MGSQLGTSLQTSRLTLSMDQYHTSILCLTDRVKL